MVIEVPRTAEYPQGQQAGGNMVRITAGARAEQGDGVSARGLLYDHLGKREKLAGSTSLKFGADSRHHSACLPCAALRP